MLGQTGKETYVMCITSVIFQKIFLLLHLSLRCCLGEYYAPAGNTPPELYELALVFSRPAITDRKPPKLDYPLYRVSTLRRWGEAEARVIPCLVSARHIFEMNPNIMIKWNSICMRMERFYVFEWLILWIDPPKSHYH